ncbi:MAG: NusG domain II-containing protein [Thermosipho sp. (in: Bacteria)]|nr:NusG domain II-containing protein [Thermosipho sp. (in: thermotogales)]
MKIVKKSDVIIITIVIVILVILFSFNKIKNSNGEFIVKLNGQEILKLSTPGEYEIKNEKGELLTIVHYDGKYVWVTNSSCPLKTCEKTGKIEKGGKIICVPNKIIIETENSQELQTW